jgi:hypothetical protein
MIVARGSTKRSRQTLAVDVTPPALWLFRLVVPAAGRTRLVRRDRSLTAPQHHGTHHGQHQGTHDGQGDG